MDNQLKTRLEEALDVIGKQRRLEAVIDAVIASLPEPPSSSSKVYQSAYRDASLEVRAILLEARMS
ncbi:hypothetical protein NG701_07545 [Pseudarthrobacter sp. HLT3-5]|uniref:hypothetical protein n=1 Tax=Pseudarthrobacter cellobiosi TaxID=2953654 RepID=UPI00208F1ED9|nr:hypothetical protein [Pseudarthrobacter sp. HLT3-5]MCO4274282.1 hypothetical protein [Pseudarthrobacter sp. HLT3-5]